MRESFYESQSNVNQYDERQSLLLIDRYSFLCLRPCSNIELASIGYKPDQCPPLLNLQLPPLLVPNKLAPSSTALGNSPPPAFSAANASAQGTASASLSAIAANDGKIVEKKSNELKSVGGGFVEPDISRMSAFKPNSRRIEFGAMQPVPGGGLFLFPSIFADMIKRLPPPQCFQVHSILNFLEFN